MDDKRIGQAVNQVVNGTKSAFQTVQRVVGSQLDPALNNYDKLTSDEFDLLRQKFGDDATMEYIKRMEIRRSKK